MKNHVYSQTRLVEQDDLIIFQGEYEMYYVW